jgi:hypothetical protein
MSGPKAFVAPNGNGWTGGTYARAGGAPTNVQGGFNILNAGGGTPPAVAAGGVMTARQNRGSNITIPLARVCPLHNKDALYVNDSALNGTGRRKAYEYDGLEAGELAWCLGKCFEIPPVQGVNGPFPSLTSVMGATHPTNLPLPPTQAAASDAFESDPAARDRYNPTGDGALRNQVGAFNGYGPDRMQRLAYTAWMEAFFRERVGVQTIDLLNRENAVGAGVHGNMDGEIATHRPFVAGASVFAVADIAYGLHTPFEPHDGSRPAGQKVELPGAQIQGLFAMETGPFLRSMSTDTDPVPIRHVEVKATPDAPNPLAAALQVGPPNGGIVGATSTAPSPDLAGAAPAPDGRAILEEVPRNLGSELAQRGLACILRRYGMMNWMPDGIVLSKLENGPDPYADMEYDARSGALFNIGIAGPAVTKSWTGDHRMEAQPLDKVFILMVADLSYELKADGTGNGGCNQQGALTRAMARMQREDADPHRLRAADDLTLNAAQIDARVSMDGPRIGAGDDADTEYSQLYGAFLTAYREWRANEKGPGLYDALKDALRALNEYMGVGSDGNASANRVAVDDAGGNSAFNVRARGLRSGTIGLEKAQLSNFRLMRATSSFLTNYSNPFKRTNLNDARCGLPIGFDENGANGAGAGAASYIVGGWCIGTILDSGASRAAVSNQVRTAPCSMAMNINVNVQWWTADELYTHYMDVPYGSGVTPNAAGAPTTAAKESTVKSRAEETALKVVAAGQWASEQPKSDGPAVDDTGVAGHTRWAAGSR